MEKVELKDITTISSEDLIDVPRQKEIKDFDKIIKIADPLYDKIFHHNVLKAFKRDAKLTSIDVVCDFDHKGGGLFTITLSLIDLIGEKRYCWFIPLIAEYMGSIKNLQRCFPISVVELPNRIPLPFKLLAYLEDKRTVSVIEIETDIKIKVFNERYDKCKFTNILTALEVELDKNHVGRRNIQIEMKYYILNYAIPFEREKRVIWYYRALKETQPNVDLRLRFPSRTALLYTYVYQGKGGQNVIRHGNYLFFPNLIEKNGRKEVYAFCVYQYFSEWKATILTLLFSMILGIVIGFLFSPNFHWTRLVLAVPVMGLCSCGISYFLKRFQK
ncbi:hypothetical protein KAX02_07360 [candidate division WOR-3 bacterium]|nr:hypothetical protein [candidate division WOR-3 bacterium]